jgi:hypothetical protein
MRKWFLWAILIAVFLLPQAAVAQAGLVIDRLEVDIWPEYDRPEALVIYHLFLTADTALPTDITLRIPAAAGEPYNVAVRDTDGNLYVVDYTRQVDGEWALITFTAPRSEVQFEYYDPGLQKNGPGRTFVYHWPGDYPVNDLSIQVQQPVGASAMEISPNLGAGLTGTDGMIYYNAKVGEVPENNPFEVSLRYQKPDDALSVQTIKVEPSGPISQDTAGRTNFSQYLPWILGALGVILLVGGGIWYYQSQHPPQTAAARRRHTGAVKTVPGDQETDELYCFQCGRRAGPGDRFCRTCGAPLRT